MRINAIQNLFLKAIWLVNAPTHCNARPCEYYTYYIQFHWLREKTRIESRRYSFEILKWFLLILQRVDMRLFAI